MALIEKKTGELLPQEIELIKEAAAALARCGERLERALSRLRQAEMNLDEVCAHGGISSQAEPAGHALYAVPEKTPDASLIRAEAVEQYRQAREKAEKAHAAYIIQREAIGLRSHRFVDKIYPLPPRRRTLS